MPTDDRDADLESILSRVSSSKSNLSQNQHFSSKTKIKTPIKPKQSNPASPASLGSPASPRSNFLHNFSSSSSSPNNNNENKTHRSKLPQQRKDVSFLRDTQTSNLTPSIPPTLIPEADMITEESMFPPEDKARKCWYDPEKKVYVSVVFPSMKPTGRHDVELLSNWLSQALGETNFQSNINNDNRSQIVRNQLSKLQIGFREVVRQVAVTCHERGVLLDKIWKSMSDLLEYVMQQMQTTIMSCESRMGELNLRAGKHESDLLGMKSRHNDEVSILTQTIGYKWGQRLETVKQALIKNEIELESSSQLVAQVKTWFPSFSTYAPTVLSSLLPPLNNSQLLEQGLLLPEEALKNDIKRVVEKCMFDRKLIEANADSDDDEGEVERERGGGGGGISMDINTQIAEEGVGSKEEEGAAHHAALKQTNAPKRNRSLSPANSPKLPSRKRSAVKRKESIFRSLMTASKEYQSEIEHLQNRVKQLEKEKNLDKLKHDQKVKEMEKHHSFMHNLVMKSTITAPLVPQIRPQGGLGAGGYSSPIARNSPTHHRGSHFNESHLNVNDMTGEGVKIINAGRVQRECIRFIKSYALFVGKRTAALLKGNIRNSNTWWMLKLSFGDFVKQQVSGREPPQPK